MSSSSMTGYENRLCAVRPPSYNKAANVVAAQTAIRMPSAQHVACNFLNREDFPVPPGPLMK